jgi:hypothetical protein
MGVIYVVVPLTADVHEQLREVNVSFPSEQGRHPTLNEIREAVRRLPDISAKEHGPLPSGEWQVAVDQAVEKNQHAGTLICAYDVTDPNTPCQLCFEKGSPQLIVAILHELSAATGPLVAFPDTEEAPAVVWRGQSCEDILRTWVHAQCE